LFNGRAETAETGVLAITASNRRARENCGLDKNWCHSFEADIPSCVGILLGRKSLDWPVENMILVINTRMAAETRN